jgi:hypothetical protein
MVPAAPVTASRPGETPWVPLTVLLVLALTAGAGVVQLRRAF